MDSSLSPSLASEAAGGDTGQGPTTRRAHRKSRAGCAECRRRRIKCDETRPRCSACTRHAVECVYRVAVGAPRPPSRASSPQPPPAAFHGTVPIHAYPDSLFTIDDLFLFHHWTQCTSRTIVEAPQALKLWQDVLPQIGFTSPFVLHAILSISALHLAYTQPELRQQRLRDGVAHHNKGLPGFRSSIDRLSDEVSDAVFAFSILNNVYVLASFGRHLDEDSSDSSPSKRRQRLLGCEWIYLIRGVNAVLHPVHTHVRKGPLAPLLAAGQWQQTDPDLHSTDHDERFRSLSTSWSGSHDAPIYDNTLHLLRKNWAYTKQGDTPPGAEAVWGHDPKRAGPMLWLHTCSIEFLDLLRQRQPPALLLFAYVGILFHELEDMWYLESWGRDMIGAVDDILGDYWARYMEWPKEVVGLR